jgi:hypothetical protein
MSAACLHLDHIGDVVPSSWGCEDCLAEGRQDWAHLRVCQECGHVGCCDSSQRKHATGHFQAVGHPVMRSLRARRGLVLVLPRRARFRAGRGPASSFAPLTRRLASTQHGWARRQA